MLKRNITYNIEIKGVKGIGNMKELMIQNQSLLLKLVYYYHYPGDSS